MKLKYLGGEVLGGLHLTVGKVYNVINQRFDCKELAIKDDDIYENGIELWLYEQEIEKCFEVIE